MTTNMTMMAIAAAPAELRPAGFASGVIGLPEGLTMTPREKTNKCMIMMQI